MQIINNIMTSYQVPTPAGLIFYLSLNHETGVTCIIVEDRVTMDVSVGFFTDIDHAVDYIRTF